MIIEYFQKRFALTLKGAKNLKRGIIASTVVNLSLMFPAIYLFFFLMKRIEQSAQLYNKYFWLYIIVAIILFILMFIINRWQYDSTYTSIYAETANSRVRLAEKLRRLPISFFGKHNLSDLTSTIMEDCSFIEQMFSHAVPQLFAAFISIFIMAVALFIYDWRLALALLWVVPVSLFIIIVGKANINKISKSNYNDKRDVTEKIQEGLECVQEIKSYNGEKQYNDNFKQQLKLYEKELMNTELVPSVFINISMTLLKLGMPSVIMVGVWLIGKGEVSIFVYLVFLVVSAMIYKPIEEVFMNLARLVFIDVRINRIKEIENMPEQTGSTELKISNYDIVFRNVNFAYEKNKQVLHNVSFTAKQGEVTALVGPSGGGKSTAAKLSARFWDIDSGKITIGGINIADIDPETLLKNYAIVFQDVILFNASVADNIRIGKRDASDEEIKRAARLAQCEEFINKMPNGYDTIIGENGETISGGERQRISIARALLKDAPIILLDEATASLDAENETKIQTAISELIRNKTVLIIAHRMRTVRNADKIVVLNGGTVTEQGNPEDLMKGNSEFAQMVKLQQTDYSIKQ